MIPSPQALLARRFLGANLNQRVTFMTSRGATAPAPGTRKADRPEHMKYVAKYSVATALLKSWDLKICPAMSRLRRYDRTAFGRNDRSRSRAQENRRRRHLSRQH